MTPLRKSLERLVAWQAPDREINPIAEWHSYSVGTCDENKRLAPVIARLLDVSCAAYRWNNAWASQDTSDSGPALREMQQALTALRALVKGDA